MTDGEWAAEHFARIIAEANERQMSVRKLCRALAGMCGNMIALNCPADEHQPMLDFVRGSAEASLESELASPAPRQ